MNTSPIEIVTQVGGEQVTVATLYPNNAGGMLSYTESWVAHPSAYALSPAVPLKHGTQPLTADRGRLPTVLSDSAPDRWGRTLIGREFAATGKHASEIDFLLGVDDRFRLGSLRFRRDGQFLSPPGRVPKVVELTQLEAAARDVETGNDSTETLRCIVRAGSSLGGARPKVTVIDERGHLMLAKFTSVNDDIDTVAWEKVCLDIAAASGARTPRSYLTRIADRPVLVMDRFDRTYTTDGAETRVPYISAMTLLDRTGGDRASMVEIAEEVRRLTDDPDCLPELFTRSAVNLLVGNTDNHLRNHGFLRHGDSWSLSPVFDITPATTKIDFSTPIDPGSPDTIDTLLTAAEWFDLSYEAARARLAAVVQAVDSWRELARNHAIPARQDALVAAGFESRHLDDAREATHGVKPYVTVPSTEAQAPFPRCSVCNRPLTDPESIARGAGRTCAARR